MAVVQMLFLRLHCANTFGYQPVLRCAKQEELADEEGDFEFGGGQATVIGAEAFVEAAGE